MHPLACYSSAQQFLRDLDKKLWSAADRLRANLDAAVYKHAVLGLIFLRYVSDSFSIRQAEIEAQLRDPQSDSFLNPADYESAAQPAMGLGGFFVQSERFIESRAERDRPPEAARRVSAAARINHGGKLGHLSVYGQDKSARRKRRFGLSQRARRVSTRTRAKQSNPTTWRLAAMNMAIRGIDFNFGKEPANSFTSDQHPDLRADYVMANPPFNISKWWDAKLEGDPRWRYGTPPQGNANFAWIQHTLHHLAPRGSMAFGQSEASWRDTCYFGLAISLF